MSADTNTPLDIQEYYQSLLIMQYLDKPKASGTIGVFAGSAIMPQTTIQQISFSLAPTSGTFVLSYNAINSSTLNWNDSISTIQASLQAISGLSLVTVTGSIASQSLIVTFTGVIPPALSLIQESNTLVASSTPVTFAIIETDITLPLAVQNGFNLLPNTVLGSLAIGTQLDILGKYCGVTRSGQGFTQFIVLDDADFYTLIQMAIAQNSAGSSMADITSFLYRFFGTNVLVFDNLNMTMTYIISSSIGSLDVVELLIAEGLLPDPMTVRLLIIYVPVPAQKLFAWGTYANPVPAVGHGFNTYASYDATGHWLTYNDVITTP